MDCNVTQGRRGGRREGVRRRKKMSTGKNSKKKKKKRQKKKKSPSDALIRFALCTRMFLLIFPNIEGKIGLKLKVPIKNEEQPIYAIA